VSRAGSSPNPITATTSPGSAWRYSAPGHWPAGQRNPRSPRSPPGYALDGHPPAGGGIWWRRGDDFKNAPANGPAAVLAARAGDLEFATTITDWIAVTLIDPQTGLVRDGVRLNPDGSIRTVEATTYTYCQGVYLGACVELAERDGHPRWAERAATALNAVTTMAGPEGVIPGGGRIQRHRPRHRPAVRRAGRWRSSSPPAASSG
jgi:Glycosyl hydrolase family 76